MNAIERASPALAAKSDAKQNLEVADNQVLWVRALLMRRR